jgi:hypothetical protein
VSTPIVTTLSTLQVESRRHDEQTGLGIQIPELISLQGGVVFSHDLPVVRMIRGEPVGVRLEWFGSGYFLGRAARGFLRHRRKPSGNGSSGASMCCDVPVIQARPVMVGTIAG